MEAGRSWPDVSSLERVLNQDYWPGLLNSPFKGIQKAEAGFESNYVKHDLIQGEAHFLFHVSVNKV